MRRAQPLTALRVHLTTGGDCGEPPRESPLSPPKQRDSQPGGNGEAGDTRPDLSPPASCLLGPPRRARPRLVSVRPADNLRGAPGGPADANGTSESPPPADRWLIGLPRGSTPAAGRGRREIRSCWGVSRLPFLPAGSTPCEWAELPRELSTVSHSGQADAQRGQGVLEARDIELSLARAPRHEIHRQRGAACDRFRGFCNAHAAELGLRKIGLVLTTHVGLTVLISWAAH